VLGIIPAQSHDGAVVYVQELMGVERQVSLAAGLVRFSRARVVDFLERDQGEWVVPEDGRVMIPIRGSGVTAVLLSGLELNTG
jgi:ethanolamine utilization protein EutQ (cupin superfamily)